MHNFDYHSPNSLSEALALYQADLAHSRYLAGGTDLFLLLEHGQQDIRTVIDLKRIPNLAKIEATGDGAYRIGALTPMAEVEKHPDLLAACPALCEAASKVGGPAVRNRATLGGNVCNASPAADTATPLLVLDARCQVAGPQGERTIPLAEFFESPRKSVLGPGEILVALEIPRSESNGGMRSGNAFARVTRSAMDIAVVNAAAWVCLDGQGNLTGLRVALGAVAPTPLLLKNVAQAHLEKPVDGTPLQTLLETVRAEAEAAAKPIDDVRASAAYRQDVAGTLAQRAVAQAIQRTLAKAT